MLTICVTIKFEIESSWNSVSWNIFGSCDMGHPRAGSGAEPQRRRRRVSAHSALAGVRGRSSRENFEVFENHNLEIAFENTLTSLSRTPK